MIMRLGMKGLSVESTVGGFIHQYLTKKLCIYTPFPNPMAWKDNAFLHPCDRLVYGFPTFILICFVPKLMLMSFSLMTLVAPC